MPFCSAGIYLLGFAVLRRRLAGASAGEGWRTEDGANTAPTAWGLALQWLVEPALWLTGLMALAALAYALSYPVAVKSNQALTLLAAAMVGQGAGLWESRKQKAESRNRQPGSPKSNSQSPKRTQCGVRNAEGEVGEGSRQDNERGRRGDQIVLGLILLLAVAAVWQGETENLFQYRGKVRWSGLWENPNTFGMLMGVGVVLAVGLLVSGKAESRKQKAEMGRGKAARRWAVVVAAGIMGVGLVKSYSRGAWVGVAAALAYLAYQVSKGPGRKVSGPERNELHKSQARKAAFPLSCGSSISWLTVLPRNRVALAVICASLVVLGFWSLGHTEGAVARRAYSVANANDFSWRNRVAAWEGALQMMAEKPWFGFGWNQPERVCAAFYCPPKVDEGMAIQLNDYLTLGTTLGLPALFCFMMYVVLALSGRQRPELPVPPTLDSRLQTLDSAAVCRAGAIVLLVGFWFDGGLFKLATAAPFWILLELGREGDYEIHERHENE